jgi:protein phosphatase
MDVPRFNWTSSALSDVGLVRRVNEDAILDLPARGLWAVADGMGGHAHGEIASRMVVDALAAVSRPRSLADYIDAVRVQLLATNQALRRLAAAQDVPIIGSTVVTLLAIDRECAVLWAGDSRAYRLGRRGLRQLTRDHSVATAIHPAKDPADRQHVRSGTQPRPAGSGGITRAVGAADTLQIDMVRFTVEDGAVLLLCSDGLSREVGDADIIRTLVAASGRNATQALVALALQRGGRDNVSVIVVSVQDMWSEDRTALNPAC